ncbi:MAG: DNA polymerase [bacterium]|nr:DNA polymerase [bacterium]
MKTLLIIDASAIIHRSFHALPPLTSPTGEPINAIYGLVNTLIKVLTKQPPDYIAAAFDRPEPTFRKKMFADYKAHRPPAPSELISQIIKAREVFAEFKIPPFEIPGYEGDDLIGTLTEKFRKENDLKIIVLTGDLDTLQLVEGSKIVVQFLEKKIGETKIYDEEAVRTRYELRPDQLIDYKALVGDPSDNIPGLKGVGQKTAAGLLQKYDSLERIYAEMPSTDKLAPKILPFQKEAFLCKKLAAIDLQAPLTTTLEDLRYNPFANEEFFSYLSSLGFQSLVNRLRPIPVQQAFIIKKENEEVMEKDDNIFIFTGENISSDQTKQLESLKIKIAADWSEIMRNLPDPFSVQPPIFDLKIAAWLIDSDEKDYDLETLCRRFLRQEFLPAEEEKIINRLYAVLKKKIKELEMESIFEKIEMPLVPILAQMEKSGIGLNVPKLKILTKKIKEEIEILEKEIFQLAGTEFNLNSPKQMGEIIFEKIGLIPPKKKAKVSTAEDFLQTIKDQHPIVAKILEYRELFKLKSTYFEPFTESIGPDNRLHARFLQTNTTTGRLASAKPNMQNLPQDSSWSQPFRNCFEATPDWQFLSFDYSQIELRLLAAITDCLKLKKAFAANQDVHQLTASQVLKVPFDQITSQQRRLGKTLNFGVIYGMGANNFAKQSGVSRTEAQAFISEYFHQFPEIKDWQEKTKESVRQQGWVANVNGRRRWFQNFNPNFPRSAAEIERAAINMPIQSLGADIIKMAMIAANDFIVEKNRSQEEIRLLLSIHDELLFEVKNDILISAAANLKKIMENVLRLDVPLKVETKIGPTWGQLKTFLAD